MLSTTYREREVVGGHFRVYICHRVILRFVPVTIIGGVRGGVFSVPGLMGEMK